MVLVVVVVVVLDDADERLVTADEAVSRETVVMKRDELGVKVKVCNWRAAVFQRRVVERAAGCTGVTVVRGEVPFQVSRGRMERGTSVTVFGGAILIVYWNGNTSRGRQSEKVGRSRKMTSVVPGWFYSRVEYKDTKGLRMSPGGLRAVR